MIISIDPGITNCGVSLIEEKGDKLIVRDCINIVGTRKLNPDLKELTQQYGDRSGKVLRISEKIIEIIEENPDIKFIAIEAPFFNRMRPAAFESLLEVVFVVKYKVAVPRSLDLVLVAPMLVKKHWTDKGNAKKEMMLSELEKRVKEGSVILPRPIETLTEHEIDSIAVGYTSFREKELQDE